MALETGAGAGFNPPVYIPLDRDSSEPLSRQIALYLEELIRRGHVALGGRLPSSRSLARSLRVSRETVEAAYTELAARSVIVITPGRGASVEPSLSESVELALPFPEPRSRDPLPAHAWRTLENLPDAIDFRGELPGTAHYSSATLRGFLRQSLEAQGGWLGQAPPTGESALRHAASHVFASVGVLSTWEEMAIFANAEEAAAAVLSLFVPDRGMVASLGMVDPRMIRALKRLRAQMIVLPEDDVEAMRRRFHRHPPHLLAIPSDQGIVPRRPASIALRRALLDAAREASIPILEDASRAPGALWGESSALLSVLDRSGRVSTLLDLSDEVRGGFDAAAVAVTPKALDRLRAGRWSSGHAFDRLQQRVLALAIDSPGRARIQRALFEKRTLIAESVKRGIQRRLSALTGYEFSAGMRSVRLDLPAGISSSDVQSRAAKRGVGVWSAADCGVKDGNDSFLLLELMSHDEGELVEGIRLLGEALSEAISSAGQVSVRSPGPEAVPS